MTKLSNHQSSQTTKLLLIGDSGAGKTGALASLAAAGYRVRVIDFDNGLDTLANVLKDPKGGYPPAALDRVSFMTLTDKMKNSGGKLIPGKATAWQNMVKLLNGEMKWGPADRPEEQEDLGPVSSWTSEDILVIDSLTKASKAAMDFVLMMNVRLGQRPWQSDYGDAQGMIDSLLQTLYDENISCNVIIIAHIAFMEDQKGGTVHGYPKTVGKALSPTVGTYFNSILQVKTEDFGKKRVIVTKTSSMIELKNSAPTRVKDKYDQASGLADYFKDVRSGTSASTAAATGPAAVPPSHSVAKPKDQVVPTAATAAST